MDADFWFLSIDLPRSPALARRLTTSDTGRGAAGRPGSFRKERFIIEWNSCTSIQCLIAEDEQVHFENASERGINGIERSDSGPQLCSQILSRS